MGLGERFSFAIERDDVRDIGFRLSSLRLNNSKESREIEVAPRRLHSPSMFRARSVLERGEHLFDPIRDVPDRGVFDPEKAVMGQRVACIGRRIIKAPR